MSKLSVTLIDVGWGDSIFIESERDNGERLYALVDSNDTSSYLASYMFLEKYFVRREGISKPYFDFIMLTHGHADHSQGLKKIIKDFQTKQFWYPKTEEAYDGIIDLVRYSDRYGYVRHHQSIDDSKIMPSFGDVEMKILWPKSDSPVDPKHNNNSIVLAMTLGDVSFVLTGDAEKEVWREIADKIPANTAFLKVPHHGSVNGTFDGGDPAWLDNCPATTKLGISCHIWPRDFNHPHKEVTDLFDSRGVDYYRTDEHYHVTFQTDGASVEVKYSRI